MRTFLLLLIFLTSTLIGNGQNAYLSDNLLKAMKESRNENTRFKVVILMDKQADLVALQEDFDEQGLSLDTRRQLLPGILQRTAKESQADALEFITNYLRVKKMDIPEVQSFWIVNMLVMELPVSLIVQLEGRTDIELIDLAGSWKVAPSIPLKGQGDEKIAGGTEPGLVAIKAPFMWNKGYTGKNRISYSIDTGVWPDHPAISNRFLANYFPYSQSWYPYDALFPADKTGSHGTHTLGTTLGLVDATHDTIGMAFNAYWICSDPVATSLATVKPLSDFMYAFQWAMNPDGDTNTTWDIPDVINNSWGYEVATDTLLCGSYVSQMFLAVEAAGIANVFSAGNDGPGPMTIGIPHHLNDNIVNSFTVGALDANTPAYTIASFSSRGPSICGGSGSILIKPEVSAPGVNVRSCVLHDTYDYYSGTSMAAPHVTGAVLLLKEAFPFLPGKDILEALYYTANDLGDPGEDNTYGMGMIDLEKAFNYLDSLYTPVTPYYSAVDAVLQSINFPQGNYFCDTLIAPEAVLYNAGDSTLNNGIFHYRLNNGILHSQAWSGNLSTGQSQTVSLGSVPTGTAPYSELSVWFECDSNLNETLLINNHRMARFHYRPKSPLPFIEDFENGIDSLLWMINNPNYNLTWDTLAAGGLLYSNYSAVIRFNQSLPTNQLDDLITPSFDFSSADSLFLSFDVSYQNVHPVLTDTLKIAISTDCGQSFPTTIYKKGGQELQTYDTVTMDFVPWRADQWRHETISLSAFEGNPEALIKFTGHNKRGNNLFIDNIKVYTGQEPSGSAENITNAWQIYPNPAGSFLNVYLNGDKESRCTVLIRDLSGKICVSNQEEINGQNPGFILHIAALPAGLYILQIIDSEEVYTTKFIKTKY